MISRVFYLCLDDRLLQVLVSWVNAWNVMVPLIKARVEIAAASSFLSNFTLVISFQVVGLHIPYNFASSYLYFFSLWARSSGNRPSKIKAWSSLSARMSGFLLSC